MKQAKFTIEQSHIDFLEQFKDRGFKDKSEIVRLALDRLAQELERQELIQSADSYAEIYREDRELQQLTAVASVSWPK
jgi:Arc/MetJ-type ribon-helix-helix transcriptional regulator